MRSEIQSWDCIQSRDISLVVSKTGLAPIIRMDKKDSIKFLLPFSINSQKFSLFFLKYGWGFLVPWSKVCIIRHSAVTTYILSRATFIAIILSFWLGSAYVSFSLLVLSSSLWVSIFVLKRRGYWQYMPIVYALPLLVDYHRIILLVRVYLY